MSSTDTKSGDFNISAKLLFENTRRILVDFSSMKSIFVDQTDRIFIITLIHNPVSLVV